jgi:hypothetical protein
MGQPVELVYNDPVQVVELASLHVLSEEQYL